MVAPVVVDGPAALTLAADALRAGSVVALPTDTVYGLAVDPLRPGALSRLFSMKARPADVPVPVLVGSRSQADLVAVLDGVAAALAARFWPGPLTLVVPRAEGFTADLGGAAPALGAVGTVGIRWPDHPVVAGLCDRVGPLAVTSANRHGEPPAVTAEQVVVPFPPAEGPALVVDGGRCDRPPSTVADCQGGTVRCLRQGTIAWSDVLDALSGPLSLGRRP